ncbi:MAG: hypothetical protein P8012_17895 [Desulfobacterales bacterium]
MGVKFDVETRRFEKFINNYTKGIRKERVPDALKSITLDVVGRVIEKNPVDLGRSRAGWYAYLDDNMVPVPAGGNPEAVADGRSKGSYVEKFDISTPFIEIRNAVNYTIYLEYGHSAQAPLGMVRLSMREVANNVTKRFLEEMKKESLTLNR